MPRTCSVCSSPQRNRINDALLAGYSVALVSKNFGVGIASTYRHVGAGHVRAALEHLDGAQAFDPTDVALRLVAVADDAREARRAANALGRTVPAMTAANTELKALDLITSRLGLDDTELLDTIDAAQQVINAVLAAVRANPALGDEVALQLVQSGHTEYATEIHEILENQQKAISAHE